MHRLVFGAKTYVQESNSINVLARLSVSNPRFYQRCSNVTYHSNVDCIANSVSQAFPWEAALDYLMRDRNASGIGFVKLAGLIPKLR